MPTNAPNGGAVALIVPLAIFALVILRNSRARRLRIESLWVAPTLILIAVGLSLYQQGMPTPLMMGVDVVALALGAGLGWWRARFTHITVDTATHQLTSRASPIGMFVVLGLFAVRYGVRFYTAQNANALGFWATIVSDGLLVMSVGLVCAQRLEIALRASRLLNEARANAQP
jgi:hypothetical protein